MANLVLSNPTTGTPLNGVGTEARLKAISRHIITKDGVGDFVCSDYADDATCIQAALDAATSGDELKLLEGSYAITSELTGKSQVSLIAHGNVTFTSSLTSAAIIDMGSSHYSASTILLSSNAAKGAESIVLSAVTGLVIGDWLKIGDNTYISILTDDYYSGEIVRIIGITDTTVTIDRPLYDAYTTANAAYVRKIAMVQDVRIEGIDFVGAGNETESKGLRIYGAYNLSVNRCSFTNFGTQALEIGDVLESRVKDSIFRKNFYTGLGYSIAVANACDNLTIDNCKFKEKGRHYIMFGASTGSNIDGGYLRGWRILNCDFENSTQEAINFHEPNKAMSIISGCKFLGCDKGIEIWNGLQTVVANNIFVDCGNPVETHLAGNTLVTGNHFKNFTQLYLLGDTDVIGNTFDTAGYIGSDSETANIISVIDNVFHGYTDTGIYVNGSSSLFEIEGNRYYGDGSDLFLKMTSCGSVKIENNRIVGGIELQSCSNVSIAKNNIDATTYGIRINPAAGLHLILNNEIKSTSRGISLEASGSNSSVIKIRRNYINSSDPVINTSNYYTALDDDSVRI